MKQIFNVEKFIEHQKNCNIPEEFISQHLEMWVYECDGIAKEEMINRFMSLLNSWVVEVEE